MKNHVKVFISLTVLFMFCILYIFVTTVNTTTTPTTRETFESFYDKFNRLKKKLTHNDGGDWDFPYPTFYINLDSDIDKNKFITDQIDYHKCKNIQRISGVDGRHSTPVVLNVGQNTYPITTNFTLTNPEMGCLLSHLKTIIHGYLQGFDIIIVMENDVFFQHAKMWKKTIQDIVKDAPPDWTLLNLYSSTIICKQLFKQQEYVLHDGTDTTRCYLAACYIINRRGMYNILKNINFFQGVIQLFTNDTNAYHGADEILFQWADKTYFVNPTTIFVYNDNDSMKTSIQNDSDLSNQIENATYVIDQYIKK